MSPLFGPEWAVWAPVKVQLAFAETCCLKNQKPTSFDPPTEYRSIMKNRNWWPPLALWSYLIAATLLISSASGEDIFAQCHSPIVSRSEEPPVNVVFCPTLQSLTVPVFGRVMKSQATASS